MVSISGLKILLLLAGFVWWSIAFVTLYAVQSIGCGWGWHLETSLGGLSFLRVVLIGLFIAFCVVGILITLGFVALRRKHRGNAEIAEPVRFLESSGAFAAYAAAVAILLTFAPILYASPCS